MFRFKKLQPWDIKKFADEIRHTLVRSAPSSMPRTQEAIRSIFAKLVGGEAQAWILYREDSRELYGMMITAVLKDYIADSNFLFMYALAAVRKTDVTAWEIGLEALQKFARANNCTVITGITYNPKVTEFAKQIGARVTDFVTLEV